MKLVFELWQDESPGRFTLCNSGPVGNEARAQLVGKANCIKTFEAESHYDVMTQYYRYQHWGKYVTNLEQDHWPFIDESGKTRNP